ncbi:MAG: CoB--CoM heterodisulfide reductase iron-sulfur subunit B family protein [Proteobacteria bacterium]|nr:CoB--CoM heterodisulfide reductase iron-sulfur subunit B family protein [Pseudomonadota bacterium]
MKVAYFPGCKSRYLVRQYDQAARLVLGQLGVELVEPDFRCCGHPARDLHFQSYVCSSARNLALAAAEGLPILVVCQCCFGSLKQADYFIGQNDELRQAVSADLAEAGLTFSPGVEVHHILGFLYDHVGLDRVKEEITRPLAGLKVAPHYGCHIQRPSTLIGANHPVKRRIFDQLIEAVGAASVEWPRQMDCCGGPALGRNPQLSADLMRKKLEGARASGAELVGVACPCCHIQFDMVQHWLAQQFGLINIVPSILYPQLLGLAMGASAAEVGLDRNELYPVPLQKYLAA